MIHFKREGGFAGLITSKEVDETDLPENMRKLLKKLADVKTKTGKSLRRDRQIRRYRGVHRPRGISDQGPEHGARPVDTELHPARARRGHGLSQALELVRFA